MFDEIVNKAVNAIKLANLTENLVACPTSKRMLQKIRYLAVMANNVQRKSNYAEVERARIGPWPQLDRAGYTFYGSNCLIKIDSISVK